jgi:hypothetical protein
MARKIVVDVPDDMYDALLADKEQTGVPIASQARVALREYFLSKGKKVSSTVGAWGGSRSNEPEHTPSTEQLAS